MRFQSPQSLATIAELIDAKFIGNPDFQVLGTNEIHRVKAGEIVFVNHPKYYDKALNSDATIILIDKEVDCPEGKALIISDDPFRDFNKINEHYQGIQTFETTNQNVKIGKNCKIHPSVIIGNDVTIGDNCMIFPNVVIGDRTIIGNNCIIQSGTVLGGDAFYYNKNSEGYRKMLSVGNVILEDHVEIGVNCCIDRGVTDSTIIKKGSKLDNLIQVGHDTVLGERTLVASGTMIAGCCIVEDDVQIWGQVGIASGKRVGKGAVLLGKTGVNKDLEGGKTYFGSLAEEFREYLKKEVKLKNL
ncbi:UDP-3-O-(3-hydroxymyristoyl)glucosamine N-acyltransferase [Cloacibacterium rupense]|uniref:UDP-3-O-(3-hydroxymyristoyl)glucosamine N-acyltransferase n=1 Tax=Cloacibacterium rupense TaxID=517423 RepID=A0ABQ2NKU3_9FLAO|nr:LpxD N-terminal domain-containing protein [Cloacibacterium rupense]GGP04993.1 UDP-3-O-(3-hydroxymyristoyl)glucosamine N-acyltransferase [Cloacibacterium rupense]